MISTTKDGRKITQSLVRPSVLKEVAKCALLDKIVDKGRSPRFSKGLMLNQVIGIAGRTVNNPSNSVSPEARS
jgi:hypothetical protein